MTTFAKLLAASAAIGSLAAAVPASAQYTQTYQQPYQQTYQQPYQQTYQQGYQQTYQQPYAYGQQQTYQQPYAYGQQGYGTNSGALGSIINSLLGNRYSVTDRTAVQQCASAAMSQAQSQYGGGAYGYNGQQRYDRDGDNRGYAGQAYGNRYGSMNVTAITNVERRGNGVRVSGVLGSGNGYRGQSAYGQQGYGNQGYGNQGYGAGSLSFRCNVAYNGVVTNIRLGRRGY